VLHICRLRAAAIESAPAVPTWRRLPANAFQSLDPLGRLVESLDRKCRGDAEQLGRALSRENDKNMALKEKQIQQVRSAYAIG